MNNRAYEYWSIEEERELIEGYKLGFTIKELAILHDRTYGAIRSRLKLLGIIKVNS